MERTVNRQIILAELPHGKLSVENFKMREAPIPKPREGELLLHVRLVSLDAANRAWMQGETYRTAMNAGSVMDAYGLAEVLDSKAAAFAPGDLVFTTTGWQDYVVLPAGNVAKVERVEPLTHLLSVRYCRSNGLSRLAFNRAAKGRRDRSRVGRSGISRHFRRPNCEIKRLSRHRDRRIGRSAVGL
jgi:NADPH-dependent curcumin reductase CurA